jgi:N-acetylmuramoyl-L-alanine amidase/FG-GAP-like repeat/FG-GAP repeat
LSKRKAHAYRPLNPKTKVWLAVGAVAVAGAGTVAVAAASPSSGSAGQAHRRPASTRVVALRSTGGGKLGAELDKTGTFSAVQVTWSGKNPKIKGTVQVRTHASGAWSGWKTLGADEVSDDPAAARGTAARAGSETLWSGPSDGVQARVTAEDGSTSTLPKAMKLLLIDPGTAPATTTARTANAAMAPADDPSPAPSASASPGADCDPVPDPGPVKPSTVAAPPIITRAQWGADENLECPSAYAPNGIQAIVVHHTGEEDGNNYTCADSAARVRGIQQEHMVGNGWNDIGYNFLVDKCGQIFEGRAGGVGQPVIGAHDFAFNTGTVGIAWIGNSMDTHPTRAALDAIARIAAWKLGQYGLDPQSSVTLTSGASDDGSGTRYQQGQSVTLPRIFGHTDTYYTACPGTNLYAKLGLIRSLAGSPGVSHALATSDYNRDGVNDLVAGLPKASSGAGEVVALPGGSSGPVASQKRVISQASSGVPGTSEAGDGFGSDTAYGDVNGDGSADLVIGAPGEDDTTGHTDSGAVTVLYGPGLTSGTSYTTASATRASGEKLGAAVASGDFNGDGDADVFAVAPGKPGRWWAFDGKSGAATSGYLASSAYTAAVSYPDAAAGDFNRDGYADVAINYRDPSGLSHVVALKGGATGLKRVGQIAAKGGRSIASGDINGDGYADVVIGQPDSSESGTGVAGGAVTAVYGSSTGLTSTGATKVYQGTSGVPGTAESGDLMGSSVAVGDYDLDGYADVLTGLPGEDITRSSVNRVDAGSALLLRGGSGGLTGTGSLSYSQDTSGITGSTESGDKFGSAVTLADLSGWARSDLAIGAAGEDSSDGTVLQLDSGSSGVSTTTGVYYSRSVLATPAAVALGGVLTP